MKRPLIMVQQQPYDWEAAKKQVEEIAGHFAAYLGEYRSKRATGSKHAVLGLGRAARPELAHHRIRVSTFCPHVIATDMVGDFQNDPRCLQPDDIAETILQIARAPEALDIEDMTVRSTNWPA